MTEHLIKLCASGVGLVPYATGRCHLVYHVQSGCCCLALDVHRKVQTLHVSYSLQPILFTNLVKDCR